MNIKLDLEKLSPVARLAAAPLLGALFVLFLPVIGFVLVGRALLELTPLASSRPAPVSS